MSTIAENNATTRRSTGQPIIQINRLNQVRFTARILDSTELKLKQYLQYASEQMDTEVTNDDVVEYALNMLFTRDSAFKSWLKRKE